MALFRGKGMIKDNSMASTVSHAENCLYSIQDAIIKNGSLAQKVALSEALDKLENLYFMLQEEHNG